MSRITQTFDSAQALAREKRAQTGEESASSALAPDAEQAARRDAESARGRQESDRARALVDASGAWLRWAQGDEERRVVVLYGTDERGRCLCHKGERCSSPGKHPKLGRARVKPSGEHGRRAYAGRERRCVFSLAEAREAWQSDARANLGILLGEREVWLDVDAREGAFELLDALLDDDDELETYVETSGDGLHIAYRLPRGFSTRGLATKLADESGRSLSVLFSGALVCVAPSSHHSGRARRSLAGSQAPRDERVATLPARLLVALLEKPFSPIVAQTDEARAYVDALRERLAEEPEQPEARQRARRALLALAEEARVSSALDESSAPLRLPASAAPSSLRLRSVDAREPEPNALPVWPGRRRRGARSLAAFESDSPSSSEAEQSLALSYVVRGFDFSDYRGAVVAQATQRDSRRARSKLVKRSDYLARTWNKAIAYAEAQSEAGSLERELEDYVERLSALLSCQRYAGRAGAPRRKLDELLVWLVRSQGARVVEASERYLAELAQVSRAGARSWLEQRQREGLLVLVERGRMRQGSRYWLADVLDVELEDAPEETLEACRAALREHKQAKLTQLGRRLPVCERSELDSLCAQRSSLSSASLPSFSACLFWRGGSSSAALAVVETLGAARALDVAQATSTAWRPERRDEAVVARERQRALGRARRWLLWLWRARLVERERRGRAYVYRPRALSHASAGDCEQRREALARLAPVDSRAASAALRLLVDAREPMARDAFERELFESMARRARSDAAFEEIAERLSSSRYVERLLGLLSGLELLRFSGSGELVAVVRDVETVELALGVFERSHTVAQRHRRERAQYLASAFDESDADVVVEADAVEGEARRAGSLGSGAGSQRKATASQAQALEALSRMSDADFDRLCESLDDASLYVCDDSAAALYVAPCQSQSGAPEEEPESASLVARRASEREIYERASERLASSSLLRRGATIDDDSERSARRSPDREETGS